MSLHPALGSVTVRRLGYRLEVMMAVPKKDEMSGRAFAVPVLWIIVLLTGYWLISDWQDLPQLFSSTIARL